MKRGLDRIVLDLIIEYTILKIKFFELLPHE